MIVCQDSSTVELAKLAHPSRTVLDVVGLCVHTPDGAMVPVSPWRARMAQAQPGSEPFETAEVSPLAPIPLGDDTEPP